MGSLRLTQLLALPAPERLLRARNGAWTSTDVRTVADRAFAARFGEISRTLDLALLAAAMSQSLPPTRRANDAKAKAQAVYGNVLRMKGDLAEAQMLLDQALRFWERGTNARPLGAFVMEFRASLWQARSLWDAATLELDRAESLRRAHGMPCAKLLIQRGLYLAHSGHPTRAVEVLEQALREAHSRDLITSALTNLAWVHTESGRPARARHTLLLARPLFDRAPSGARLPLLWIEARISDLEGFESSAETLYRRARHAYARNARPQEAAVCGIDLALLLARRGDLIEAYELSQSAAQLLAMVGGRAEEHAARLLASATAQEIRATLAVVIEVLAPFRTAVRRSQTIAKAPATASH